MKNSKVKIQKLGIIFCLVIISCILVITQGCGKGPETSGTVTNVAETIPVKADNPQIQEFNKQLSDIKDMPSAEKAVETFVNYVDSRSEKTSGLKIKSILDGNIIKRMAAAELAMRNGKSLTISSTDEVEIPTLPIDIGTLTDTINSLGKDNNIRLDDNTVTKAKVIVEESVPNLNPENKEEMTPLGAMVVGYALISGDDGSAPENSIKMPAEKVSSFVTTITQ